MFLKMQFCGANPVADFSLRRNDGSFAVKRGITGNGKILTEIGGQGMVAERDSGSAQGGLLLR